MALLEKGNYPCISEDWLLENLPQGWRYDRHFGDEMGFLIYPPHTPRFSGDPVDPEPLFLPLALLELERRR